MSVDRYVIFVLLVIHEKVELPTASLVVINIDHFQRTIVVVLQSQYPRL